MSGSRVQRTTRLAILCPLVAAALLGAFDALVGLRGAEVELGAGETAGLLAYASGRHLVGGAIVALVLLAAVALSSRRRIVDAGLLLLATACAWFFVDATWDLYEGARISTHRLAPALRLATRFGGPVAILVALAFGKRLLLPFLDPARLRVAGVLLGVLCAAAALALMAFNARWLPGLYPGVHALLAAGSLLAGTLAVFFALRRRRSGRELALALAGACASLFAASVVLHVSEGFDRTRAHARGMIRGTAPVARVVERLYGLVSGARVRDVGDVSALLAEMRRAQDVDHGAMLDRLLPDRRELNVLLVAMDTVRYDHTGLGGYAARPTTPNLDRLAARSYAFEAAYTPYPTSNYAYTCILTGTCAGASPLHGHRSRRDWQWPQDVYYARLLSGAGWHTNGVAAFDRKDRANQRFFGYVEKGFDVFNADQTFDRAMVGHEITASAKRQILARPKDPFFLFAHYLDPHDPYETREGFDFGPGTKERYDSEIAYTDAQLGELLALLEQQGLADSTIVVVFSDHGEALGDHGLTTHNTSVYDAEIRVPLVLHVPGLPGGRVGTSVSLIDVMPTVTQILGVADPVRRMGRNLLPWMLGVGPTPDLPAFAEQFTVRQDDDDLEQRCVVYRRKKIIETVGRPESTFMLFDLAADPGEKRNLFGLPEQAAAQAELLGLLRAAVAQRDAYHEAPAGTGTARTADDDVRAALTLIRATDPDEAQRAASDFRNLARSRYDELSDRYARVDPVLLAELRAELLRQADAALPRVRWEIVDLMRLLPDEAFVPYLRKLLEHQDGRARAEGARALATLGKEEARPVLEQVLAAVPDPAASFPAAMALSRLGDHRRVAIYAPMLRSGVPSEAAPLLLALARARDPAGLPILAERLMLNLVHDFKLKEYAALYAAAVPGPDADFVLAWIADDADRGLRDVARAVLEARLGKDGAAVRLERFRIEREAIAAQMNGRAELAADGYRAYVVKYPDAEARIFLGFARALARTGDAAGVRAALERMRERGNPEEAAAAARMLRHQADLKWFYRPEAGEWKATVEVLDRPQWFLSNRSYFLKVRLTNASNTYWAGGAWVFGPVLRTDLTDAAGNLFDEDPRGRKVTRREVPNFLPLAGVAPGESVELLIIGHVPSGVWKDGRVAVGFHQHGTTHIPPRESFLLRLPDPIEPR
jgi:arylsulfatase A-like enzyme